MEKKLTQIASNTVKLFDGLEDNLFGQEFSVVVPTYSKVLIKPLNLVSNKFGNLSAIIGEDALQVIVQTKHFRYENGLFPAYVGTDELSLYFALVENTLLIFSMGEYQPARYIFYLEGVWQVA